MLHTQDTGLAKASVTDVANSSQTCAEAEMQIKIIRQQAADIWLLGGFAYRISILLNSFRFQRKNLTQGLQLQGFYTVFSEVKECKWFTMLAVWCTRGCREAQGLRALAAWFPASHVVAHSFLELRFWPLPARGTHTYMQPLTHTH